VKQMRDPKADGRSDLVPIEAVPFAKQTTRLAHWPPPFRSREAKPKAVRHPHGETVQRATLRGWRITRAMISDFDD
jgi:hypothetical protein